MGVKRSWSLVFLCLALTGEALAGSAVVSCTLSQPNTFPSVTAALNSLNPAGPNQITVQGTCKENVFIPYYQNLTIAAIPGKPAVIENAANPAAIVVQAFGCRGLLLQNLVIRGGTFGLLVNQASEAVIQNLVAENNSSDGVVAQVGSTLGVDNSKFINNGGNGLTVASMANATLSTQAGETILISGNAGSGIAVDAAYLQANFGPLRVLNNAGAAVFVANGQLLLFGGDPSAGGTNLFQKNGEGIDLFDTSSARFFGSNVIQSNGEVGLQVVNGSSAEFFGMVSSTGTNLGTTIQGHSGPGVNIVRSSAASFAGPHVIHANGSTADVLSSGIRIEHSNVTVQDGTSVSGNTGPGIALEEGGTVNVLANAVIRNNTGDGVSLSIQSNGGFFQPITISGNGGASIACDTTSVAVGNFTGIKNVNCSQLQSRTRPVGNGRVVLQ